MKFSSIRIITAFAILALFNSCEDENNGKVPQIVVPLHGDMTIPAEGGTQTLTYGIVNAVDGGQIFASPNQDWIGDFNYDNASSISFNAEVNDQTSNRSCILTLTYTYGNGKEVQKQLNIIQTASGNSLNATVFNGNYYDDSYDFINPGEHNYSTWLSDMPFIDGQSQQGGTYYQLDLYAGAPEDPSNPLPPAGTYTFDGNEGMRLGVGFTRAFQTTEDGEKVFSETFSDGTVTVERNGDNIDIEGLLFNDKGVVYHVTYSGEATYTIGDSGSDTPSIDDINITAVYADGQYNGSGKGDNVMSLVLAFTDMNVNQGQASGSGVQFWITMYMPYDKNGHIMTGDYSMDFSETSQTVLAGQWLIEGFQHNGGSYIALYEEASSYPDMYMLTEGSMNVSGTPGNYTVSGNFTTDQGTSADFTYTGDIQVAGLGPVSTLTDDYILDLEGAGARMTYYGDDWYHTGGGNWVIELLPDTDKKDRISVDLVAHGLDFDAGVPTGIYTAAEEGKYPLPGQFMQGSVSLNDGSISGTMYYGAQNSDRQYIEYAPAISGEFSVTNLGNNTYTFVFDFIDDKGFHFSGEWSGEIDFLTDSSTQPSSLNLKIINH